MSDELPVLLPENLSQSKHLNLKDFTFARIGLKRTGISISLNEVLIFKAAHAKARDAIFTEFNARGIQDQLQKLGLETLEIDSAASDRLTYLQRPDLGRILSNNSEEILKENAFKGKDVVIIIADGLSPLAVNEHAVNLIKMLVPALQKASYSIAPIILLNQGRVAASDCIGELLNAKLALILIGERPGLSSPDSLGAYLTYNPKRGLTDESRNCISNIRPMGLSIPFAAEKIFLLVNNSLTRKISGVNLKDQTIKKI